MRRPSPRIFRDVQSALLRYLRVISPEAEDVAGDTWHQVAAGLAGFLGGEREFRAWLFTIARHRAADAGRSRARRPAVPLELSGAAERHVSPDPADLALEAISARAVVALIARLPRDQAEIIMLRVVADLETGGGADRRQVPGGGAGGRAPRPAPACGPGRTGGRNTVRRPDALHGEMPRFPVPGRPGGEPGEPSLDMIFDRRPLPPEAPLEMDDLAGMVAALGSPRNPGRPSRWPRSGKLAPRPGPRPLFGASALDCGSGWPRHCEASIALACSCRAWWGE